MPEQLDYKIRSSSKTYDKRTEKLHNLRQSIFLNPKFVKFNDCYYMDWKIIEGPCDIQWLSDLWETQTYAKKQLSTMQIKTFKAFHKRKQLNSTLQR